MFADDTNLFFSDSDLSNLINVANCELDKISFWFKLNKLSLNIKKTNSILFKASNNSHFIKIEIKIDNIVIEQVSNTKFLGIIINQTLSWKNHTQLIRQKINKNIGIIRKIRLSIPMSVLVTLYYTLIHPYLSYCNLIWALDRTMYLDKLFISQKKAIRLITNSTYNAHTDPLFSKLSILTVFQLNDLQIGCFVYQCINNLLPTKFCAMFKKNASIHLYNTRQTDCLHFEYRRLCLRSNTVRHYGVSLWNSLTDDNQHAKSLSVFKAKLKFHLLTQT